MQHDRSSYSDSTLVIVTLYIFREKTEVTVENNSVKVKVAGMEHCFTYDYCFNSCGPQATQAEVFDTLVQPMLDTAFQGYNVCLFAYGQTGSGKSYRLVVLYCCHVKPIVGFF